MSSDSDGQREGALYPLARRERGRGEGRATKVMRFQLVKPVPGKLFLS